MSDVIMFYDMSDFLGEVLFFFTREILSHYIALFSGISDNLTCKILYIDASE